MIDPRGDLITDTWPACPNPPSTEWCCSTPTTGRTTEVEPLQGRTDFTPTPWWGLPRITPVLGPRPDDILRAATSP